MRCAPPQNKPTTDERDRCRPFLERELALLTGRRSSWCSASSATRSWPALLGVQPRPRFGHGVEVPVVGTGRTVVCSYHVSQQNTFTGKLTEPMLDAVFDRARYPRGARPDGSPDPPLRPTAHFS